MFCLSVFVNWESKPEPIVIEKENYKSITKLTTQVQDEWLNVLRTQPIEKIINEGYVGLATKYLVIFESGHMAIAKLVEPFRFLPLQWEPSQFDFSKPIETSSSYYARSGRKFQAWTEVAASAAARIGFPVAKKPPAAIRKISSLKLYGCQGCNSWSDFFIRNFFPEHDVYISVHAYMETLNYAPPPVPIMEYLTHTPYVHRKIPFHPEIYGEPGEMIKLVSDVVAFDYILDDHDRKRPHNWMMDGERKLLLWDSGLSFNHGPMNRRSCSSLLCGPESFQEHGKNVHKLKTCAKICRFRASTIEHLRSLSTNNTSYGSSFGSLVKKDLESAEIPVFDWNVYYKVRSKGFPKTSFPDEDFYRGLDKKLNMFLDHVSSCIGKFGEADVLMK